MPQFGRRAFLGSASAALVGMGLVACDPGTDGDGGPTAASARTSPATSPTGGASPSGSAPGAYRVHTDLAYATPVGRAHLLDLYVPTSGPGPFPVVIYQAGSAFMSDDTKGSPADAGAGTASALGGGTTAAGLAQRWAPHGYAVAGIDVRASSQAHFPAQVNDTKAAIRYLRARAAQYGLDAGRFATMGTSSGGWGAAMAGVSAGVASLEGDLGNAQESSEVQAVIDLFGPTDFLQMDAHRLPGGQEHDPASSPESQLMGFAIQSDPAAVQVADPASYVSATSPPIWISHGTADPLVPYHQSQLLFDAYAKAGASASLTLVPGAGHTDSYLASADASPGRTVITTLGGRTTEGSQPAPTYDALLAFLDEHLRA